MIGTRGIPNMKDGHPVFGNYAEWDVVTRFSALSTEEIKSLFDQTGYGGNLRRRAAEVA